MTRSKNQERLRENRADQTNKQSVLVILCLCLCPLMIVPTYISIETLLDGSLMQVV